LIAAGNTIFGFLTSSASRMLGQMAYSIYMLHGIVLFTIFKFFVTIETAAKFGPMQHWLIIYLITPILILFSFITFNLIEHPSMQLIPKIFKKSKC
jgi:peptidoglycan/LPS O-acetylase OafA/YrhL